MQRQLKTNPEAQRAGLDLLTRLHGRETGTQLLASLENVCPDFGTMLLEWALAGVMSRKGLDLKTRELLLVGACTTLGFATSQLRAHTAAALNAGATCEEIVEAILQMMFYAGGAAVNNALQIAAEVFNSRDA